VLGAELLPRRPPRPDARSVDEVLSVLERIRSET
jgi:hypothetical protein